MPVGILRSLSAADLSACFRLSGEPGLGYNKVFIKVLFENQHWKRTAAAVIMMPVNIISPISLNIPLVLIGSSGYLEASISS
jgi:hypothetical protein